MSVLGLLTVGRRVFFIFVVVFQWDVSLSDARPSLEHKQGSHDGGAWSSQTSDASSPSLQPTFKPTSRAGDPMGSQWGYGCNNVCEDNFADIMDKWDDFATDVYAKLNVSFIEAEETLDVRSRNRLH